MLIGRIDTLNHAIKIPIPSTSSHLVYNTSAQSPTWVGYDATVMTMGGSTSGTNAGSYATTFTLNQGYKWADGTRGVKSISWSIAKRSLTIPTVSGSYTYNGSSQSVTISGYNSSTMNVTGNTGTNAGSYTASFSLKDTSNNQWTDGTTSAKTAGWSISPAANTLALSPTSVTLGVGNTTITMSGNYSGSPTITLSDYAVVGAYYLGSNKISVSSKSNGSCTLTVSTPAGNYTAASKTCSITVKITISALSSARSSLAATHVAGWDGYAIFAGGGLYSAVAEAYDHTLTRSTITSLSTARQGVHAATVNDYAVFAGGYAGGSTGITTAVDAYNYNLTRSTPTALSDKKSAAAATYVGSTGPSSGTYALFAGGYTGGGMTSSVNAYNKSLTRSVASSGLSSARACIAGANTNSNYALFAGGNTSLTTAGLSAVVDAYNESLTRTVPSALSKAREYIAGANNGLYAIFAGGSVGGTAQTTVDSYNSSLTRSTLTSLNYARSGHAGCSNVGGNYALFGGGASGNYAEGYNNSGTRSQYSMTNGTRYRLAAAPAGDFLIFGGGRGQGSSGTDTNATNAYDETYFKEIHS